MLSAESPTRTTFSVSLTLLSVIIRPAFAFVFCHKDEISSDYTVNDLIPIHRNCISGFLPHTGVSGLIAKCLNNRPGKTLRCVFGYIAVEAVPYNLCRSASSYNDGGVCIAAASRITSEDVS